MPLNLQQFNWKGEFEDVNLLSIIQAILGTAEEIVPLFIHNQKSQKIEAVVVGTANAITTAVTEAVAGQAATAAAQATTAPAK